VAVRTGDDIHDIKWLWATREDAKTHAHRLALALYRALEDQDDGGEK
jgi:hypothetical protein